MRKVTLKSNKKAFGIKVEHFVTDMVFATALADYYNGKSLNFNENLSKTEARKILKERLFWYGIEGENTNMGESQIDIYNPIFDQALKWVQKNYPQLNNNNLKPREDENISTKGIDYTTVL